MKISALIALTLVCQFLAPSNLLAASGNDISASIFEDTKVHGDVIKTNRKVVSIAFASPASEFACSLNSSEFKACFSPYTMANLVDGNHELKIRDNLGNLKRVLISVDTLRK